MKRTFLWLFSLFILLGRLHPGAEAAEWTPFVEDKAFKHFYDKQSIFHSSKGLVRVAVKIDPKGKEGRDFLMTVRKKIGLPLEGYENYGFSLTVMEIDCPGQQKRILQSDDFNVKGELLDNVSPQNPKWVQIAPESVHGLYQRVLCKK